MLKESMYQGDAGDKEKERLETFSYPHQVSCMLLDDITFRSLLDAGAGPSTMLAEYIANGRGADYYAVDNGKMVVNGQDKFFSDILSEKLAQRGITVDVRNADICNLPYQDNFVDVVHVRFVMMHLPHDQKVAAINEVVRVSKK